MPFGRLVEQQQPRPHHQRPADRELLLLAAREVAAAPPEHVVEHRKQREHVVRDRAVLALERREAGLEIFLDREQRKDLAALRHIGDAAARALGRAELGDVAAVEGDRAFADRMLADERTSRLVLPTPLRPSTQVTLPGSALSDTARSACAAP